MVPRRARIWLVCRYFAVPGGDDGDVLGAALVAVGLGFVTYGIVQGGEQGFAAIAWAFAFGGVALAAFVARELRARDPLLPFYSALAGSTFFLVLFLQSVVGYTPFEAGLLLLPSTTHASLKSALRKRKPRRRAFPVFVSIRLLPIAHRPASSPRA